MMVGRIALKVTSSLALNGPSEAFSKLACALISGAVRSMAPDPFSSVTNGPLRSQFRCRCRLFRYGRCKSRRMDCICIRWREQYSRMANVVETTIFDSKVQGLLVFGKVLRFQLPMHLSFSLAFMDRNFRVVGMP